jgi:2-polyprenyl-3-methyl-5-hydroxy-6-metoxy-1,4-benzoquinol methylase
MTNISEPLFTPLVDPVSLQPLLTNKGGLQARDGDKCEIASNTPKIVSKPTNYTDAFGEEWKGWRLTQLDSQTNPTITADHMNRCPGQKLIKVLSEKSGLQVLEEGCGAGRFTEILLVYPAIHLTSTDLSLAVESNQLNFPQNEQHRVIQCDICLEPLTQGSFNLVVCLGVIQHTPNLEFTIQKLFDQGKPDGWLVIDHSTPNIKRLTKFSPILIRPILKWLSAGARMRACEILVAMFLQANKLFRHTPVAQKLLSRVSLMLTYFQ